jgi:hypothetical protein
LAPEREVLSTGELDVLLQRIHWYLGQARQVAAELVDATGAAVEGNRATLDELARALTSQRHAVAELRRVLTRRLLDERWRHVRPG